MFIIDDLLINLPAKGFLAICRRIQQLVEDELNDESKLKDQLLRLQTMYELDQISEEIYQKQEEEIMARLNEVRAQKKEQ